MLLFYVANKGFSFARLLTFTKSFASNVCRLVGCFYMMSSDFTFLFRGLYHITAKSNRNGNKKENGANVCPAHPRIVHGEALVSYTPLAHLPRCTLFPPTPHPFFFLLGITAAQREIENNASMQNFGGANKVHFGRCASGVLAICFFLSPLTVPEVFAIVNSVQFNFLLVSDVALLQ